MKTGDHQWRTRQGRIGASEAGILTGSSGYGDPTSLYRRVLALEEPGPSSIPQRMGNILEPVVLRAARDIFGLITTRCWRGYAHPDLPLSASPDAYARPYGSYPAGIAEVKTTSAQWADQPPEYVLDQVQVQLLLTHKPVCHVIVLQGTMLRLFQVEPDHQRQELILDRVREFTEGHLRPRVEPIRPPFQFLAPGENR